MKITEKLKGIDGTGDKKNSQGRIPDSQGLHIGLRQGKGME